MDTKRPLHGRKDIDFQFKALGLFGLIPLRGRWWRCTLLHCCSRLTVKTMAVTFSLSFHITLAGRWARPLGSS